MVRIPNPLPFIAKVWRWGWGFERGVKLFSLFVLAFLAGAVFALVGWAVASVVSGIMAVLFLVAMALTPSPQALTRRQQAESPEAESDGEEVKTTQDGMPTEESPVAKRAAPEPPTMEHAIPEPPSMDIIAEVEVVDPGLGGDESSEIQAKNDEDIWM